jgi:hypothetical protein
MARIYFEPAALEEYREVIVPMKLRDLALAMSFGSRWRPTSSGQPQGSFMDGRVGRLGRPARDRTPPRPRRPPRSPPALLATTPGPTTSLRVTLLVESRAGYRNLCRLLSAAAAERAKGEARAS